MLRNRVAKIAVITAMIFVLAPVAALADTSNTLAYNNDENSPGNKEYNFTLTPVNSVIATKTGDSGIKITKGNVDSITLTAKGVNDGFGSYTTNVSEFAKGLGGWLYVTLVSDKYGSFTVFAGYKEDNNQVCAVISKGTTRVISQDIEIEFTKDVVFRYDVKFNESPDDNRIGWYKDGDYWYYSKSDGEHATGWIQDGEKWYYLKSDGTMATGWQKVNNKWYYLYSNGSMACNTVIGSYTLGSDGAWVQ